MKAPYWLHHWGTAYGGAVRDDAQAAAGEMWIKANDGLHWMSRFDPHPLAVSSAASLDQAQQRFARSGIRVRAWGVVKAREPGANIAAREGALAAACSVVARAPYIVDLEPYYHGGATPQFWRNDLGAGPGDVNAFVDAYMRGGGHELWVAPDARTPHLPPVSFAAWVARREVTIIAPQVYWTDFRRPWRESLDNAYTVLRGYGVREDRVHPIFPANAQPADLVAAIQYAKQRGSPGFSLWQRGTVTPAAADAISRLADPWRASQPPLSAPGGADPDLSPIQLEVLGSLAAREIEGCRWEFESNNGSRITYRVTAPTNLPAAVRFWEGKEG